MTKRRTAPKESASMHCTRHGIFCMKDKMPISFGTKHKLGIVFSLTYNIPDWRVQNKLQFKSHLFLHSHLRTTKSQYIMLLFSSIQRKQGRKWEKKVHWKIFWFLPNFLYFFQWGWQTGRIKTQRSQENSQDHAKHPGAIFNLSSLSYLNFWSRPTTPAAKQLSPKLLKTAFLLKILNFFATN